MQLKQTTYEKEETHKDYFNYYCKLNKINELNYIFCTIKTNIPLSNGIGQLKDLEDKINRLTFPLVYCLEWCDKRANGYHIHFMTSNKHTKKLEKQKIHIESKNKKSFYNARNYACKNDYVKDEIFTQL